MLATQVMWPLADQLATQVMIPTADLLATQVMAPVYPDLLSTQVMRPAEAVQQASARMEVSSPSEEDEQVEFEKPTEQKQVKKPKTAYWLFLDEMRSQVVKELGEGCGGAKIATALAAKWKELDEESKATYKGKAQELMVQYNKEIADGAIPAASLRARKAAKAAERKSASAKKFAARKRMLKNLKRRAGPKKPKGSYSIWLCDNRKDVRARLVAEGTAEPTFEEIARAAGKTWLALTPEQKAPYLERAQALAAKFKLITSACKEYKKANVKDAKARTKKAAAKAKKQAASKAKKGGAAKAKRETKKQENADASEAKEPEAAANGKTADTPRKRTARTSRPTPSKAKKAVAAEPTAYLDMALVAEAEKAGMGGTFRKLAERDDMKSYPQRALLDALVASGGLLHRAKEVVLAGTA